MFSTQERYWKVCLRKRNDDADYFWKDKNAQFYTIKTPARYWIADPFLITKDGKDYLFVEAFDRITHKGKIGYYDLSKSKNPRLKIVIKEPYHLSFPNVYQERGKVYLIPESICNRTIQRYYSKSFPDVWELEKILVPEIYAVDSILLESMDGGKFLMTSVSPEFSPCHVDNILFRTVNEEVVLDSRQIVKSGDYGVRNGGRILLIDGKQIRIGQNCTNKEYGKGIVFWKISSIQPYMEEKYMEIDAATVDHIIDKGVHAQIYGVHSYSVSSKFEAIDYFVAGKKPMYITIPELIHRKYSSFKRMLRRGHAHG